MTAKLQLGDRISNDGSEVTEDDKVIMTLQLNDGDSTWKTEASVALSTWVNIAFTWSPEQGLSIYVNGENIGKSQMLKIYGSNK